MCGKNERCPEWLRERREEWGDTWLERQVESPYCRGHTMLKILDLILMIVRNHKMIWMEEKHELMSFFIRMRFGSNVENGFEGISFRQ